jgi:hypothetical protein
MLVALQFTSRVVMRAAPIVPLSQDVFAQRSLEHVRGALELYRLDHGHYPDRLARLVDDEWLEPAALEVPGRRFNYRPASASFQLTLGDER